MTVLEKSMHWIRKVLLVLIPALFILSVGVHAASEEGVIDRELLEHIAWRNIGPCNMGGRMTDIEGVPGHPDTLYFGTASSGLWKTTNGAIRSEPIFDEQPVHAIGDIALDPSTPDVIWVGTGEDNPRNTVSSGNGVYRSPDGGKTWMHMGLDESRHISRVIVHPANPDIVYVAAVGNAFAPHEQRGVFKTTDGGETWEKVLYIDDETGASDLEMDPSNPNILYAGMWTFMRQPWTMKSGSEKGGLHKSVDGGRTWTKLTEGLPVLMGRIGVKVAPSRPQIVYMIAESKEATLYRSEDRGETWTKVYKERDIVSRGFYFAEMRVDPQNENRVYAISGGLKVSIDGGRSFESIGGKLHSDHHTLWIDPSNPAVLVNGNDGGIGISRDYGKLWEYVRNIPLGQYYQIDADSEVPFYMVYGGLQDNGSWGLPARSRNRFGISNGELISIGGGDGFYAAVHREEPNRILGDMQGGNIYRFDTRTGQSERISPYPGQLGGAAASEQAYRFDWNAPIFLSPHDPDTVYFGGNVLFRSTDFGTSWDVVSPDLTTDDAEKQASSGGPIYPDNTTAEYHCVIVSISESPLRPGVLWVGSDDTQVQITQDGGETWENVSGNVEGMPADAIISHVEASAATEGRAYVTAERHQLDDFRPYVFKTEDFGETWENITGNLPSEAFVHVFREDSKNPDVLYVGTEIGIYVSITRGESWFPLRMKNLPAAVAVHDILIHPEENDLILGTHGRSIWVLDDIGFLQQATAEALDSPFHLFEPRKTWRYSFWTGDTGGTVWGGDKMFWGPNPDYGALLTYYLKEKPEEDAEIEIQIVDGDGALIRETEGTKEVGFNRVTWDLRHEGPEPRKPREDEDSGGRSRSRGPQAAPGEYTVKLILSEETKTAMVEVAMEPALNVSSADLDVQLETALKLRDWISSLNLVLRDLDGIEEQVKNRQDLVKKASLDESDGVEQSLADLLEKLGEIKKTIVREGEDRYGSSTKLLGKLTGWFSGISRADAAPTRHQLEYFDELEVEHRDVMGKVEDFIHTDVVSLNEKLGQYGLPIIFITESSKTGDAS
jgi:photosystem II stability/assembly factor-like uncharacterized protein